MRHYKQQRRGTLDTTPKPAVGSPSGKGRYGHLENDGVRVMCHECGQWYKSLTRHLSKHDLTTREYKIKHGLPLRLPLMGTERVEQLKQASEGRVDSAAWKKLEAKRDPTMASHSRTDESFRAISHSAAQHPERNI